MRKRPVNDFLWPSQYPTTGWVFHLNGEAFIEQPREIAGQQLFFWNHQIDQVSQNARYRKSIMEARQSKAVRVLIRKMRSIHKTGRNSLI